MRALFTWISGLIQTAITTALIGSGVLLLAGEIRLAALKKASQGTIDVYQCEAIYLLEFVRSF